MGRLLFRRQAGDAVVRRQFDVERQPVGMKPRLLDQMRRCFGDRLQMDIAAEIMRQAQLADDPDHLLHRVVGRANDAGRKEEPFDIIAAVEFQSQPDDLLRREARAFDIAGGAIDAIGAVVDAEIGQQYLQKRNAPPVRGIGMTDARPLGRTEPAARGRIAFLRTAGGTGGVIFGGIGKNGQAFGKRLLHPYVRYMFLSAKSIWPTPPLSIFGAHRPVSQWVAFHLCEFSGNRPYRSAISTRLGLWHGSEVPFGTCFLLCVPNCAEARRAATRSEGQKNG